MSIVEVRTRILPGGRIEIPSTDLPEGREATVRIVVEDEAPRDKKSFLENLGDYKGGQYFGTAKDERPKRRISDILADYPGGQLFKSAAEVDQYIKEERESWDD